MKTLSPDSHYVIGVDIGTQSTKALLVDTQGQIHLQATRSYRVDTPKPLWAEQWPEVWLSAVRECIQTLTAEAKALGLEASAIKALCISSLYGGSGIPVDADMQPLHPCLIWMDRRATAEVEWVREQVDLRQLEDITGNGVDSYYGYTKMLWLKNHRPEIWAKTRYLLPPNSYIAWCLTGELAVDHSSAGNIGGVYDIRQRQWSTTMLKALGIPAEMMPPRLVDSADVVGTLAEPEAQQLGLMAGTPLMAGGVDAAVATFAAGVVCSGDHVAMLGTSMCWGYINREVDARHGLIAMPHVYNASQDNYIFGGALTAGAAVTWFRDRFCQEEAAEAERTGIDVHVLLERQARNVPVGSDGLLFLPYLMGERSPIWDPYASACFVGIGLGHSRAHLYRAVLEGVAFALNHNMQAGARGAAELNPRLIVVGGASHSDLWMQIIADITGLPVYTIEEEVEAPLGAALLAALGAGLVNDQQVERGWVHLRQRALPDAAAVQHYQQLFSLYCQLYPNLRQVMKGLKQLANEISTPPAVVKTAAAHPAEEAHHD
ncbi:FGGY-family carbohydrate kinase [Pokkaliibacter sp. CJK22405]|uniref:FGGY-family carbohydrate kinase n=1 Tax=Pokkaliibacter sp. CJK22405 TaxID=3384615 RepID=UPI003984DDB0